MPAENADRARKAIDAVNERDLDSFLAYMDEDVECVSRIVSMEGPLRGHEGARRWWDSWFAVFPDYQIEIVAIEDQGPILLSSIRAVGHGAESSLPVEDVIWHVSQWRDGKCVWWQVFTDRDEAAEAASAR